MLVLITRPKKWIEVSRWPTTKNRWLQILIFTAIGFYGGFLHIGVGIISSFCLSFMPIESVAGKRSQSFLVLKHMLRWFFLFILISGGNGYSYRRVCWNRQYNW
jgi:hypothetical protein